MQGYPETAIRANIKQHGKITFANFMGLALYHPKGGYYTGTSPFGTSGDYFTSPEAHPVFGALLAINFQRMWEFMGRPSPFYVVELGAGNGQLARDVIDYVVRLPSNFFECLRYITIERYPWPHVIETTRSGAIQQIVSDRIPLMDIVGCLISNELVDSFPVHRFQVCNGIVKEVYVALNSNDNLVEVLGNPSTPLLLKRLETIGIDFDEGFKGEVNLNIRAWLKEIISAMRRGFIVTIDYGYTADELYSPQRSLGTIQTHFRHTSGGSFYKNVGQQDITAHVDFTSIQLEGESLGLKTIALLNQSSFLRTLGFVEMMEQLRAKSLRQRERDANMMAMFELVKSEGLGSFKVMVQDKDTGIDVLSQLTHHGTVLDSVGVPLLSSDHMPLLQGRYPHLMWQPKIDKN